MTLGERIKRLRKLNDMSQQQLADYLEINRNYLSRIETNKSEPTSSIILKLTALFEITANELLGANNEGVKKEEKRKFINDSCSILPDDDLDFVVKLVKNMRDAYVRRDVSVLDK